MVSEVRTATRINRKHITNTLWACQADSVLFMSRVIGTQIKWLGKTGWQGRETSSDACIVCPS